MEGNTGETTSLRKGAIGTWQGVFQSFSFVGPAADVAILLIGTFAFAGASSALSVLLAWLIYGLWMITPYQFSKFKANAGSYYSYAAGSTKKGMLGPPRRWFHGWVKTSQARASAYWLRLLHIPPLLQDILHTLHMGGVFSCHNPLHVHTAVPGGDKAIS